MNKILLGIVIVIAVIGLVAAGLLAANWFWTGQTLPRLGWGNGPMMSALRLPGFMANWASPSNAAGTGCGQTSGAYSNFGGMMGGRGYGGMMGGYRGSTADNSANSCPFINPNGSAQTDTRLTIEDAQAKLETYLAGETTLELAEIMEFEQNFYAVVLEKDTGRGAMELLVDPYSGSVYPEHGPNTMWNEKYGHMGGWYATTGESLTLDEAKASAQSALDEQVPGAEVEGMGIAFYGYLTFDYTVDGQIAGMLSVHNNGQTWVHTWHGAFVSEVELVE
ncbi:MAG: hypothetical protein WC837_15015 [Bellilinea sp.]